MDDDATSLLLRGDGRQYGSSGNILVIVDKSLGHASRTLISAGRHRYGLLSSSVGQLARLSAVDSATLKSTAVLVAVQPLGCLSIYLSIYLCLASRVASARRARPKTRRDSDSRAHPSLPNGRQRLGSQRLT